MSKKKVEEKKPPHRPPVEFDWDKLDKLCQYKVSLSDCAELMKVSMETIRTRIRNRFDMNFMEYRRQKMAVTRLSLQQKAMQMAMNGNTTMMIFSLKNLCNWSDRSEVEIFDKRPEFSEDQRKKVAARILKLADNKNKTG